MYSYLSICHIFEVLFPIVVGAQVPHPVDAHLTDLTPVVETYGNEDTVPLKKIIRICKFLADRI
jgi:hypothetical protein